MATGPRLVNKQFNSPIGLYSQRNIQDTLTKQSQVLNNGAVGIDFNNPINSKPSNLANSAVLRMLEEEEQRQRNGQPGRYNRSERDCDPRMRRTDRFIDWPPKTRANGSQISQNNAYTSKFFVPPNSGVKRIAWPPPEDSEGQQPGQEAPVQRQAAPEKVYQSPALTRLIPIECDYAPTQSKVYSPQPQGFGSVSPRPRSPQPAFGGQSFSPLSPQAHTPAQSFPPPNPKASAQAGKPSGFAPVPQKPQSFGPPTQKSFASVSPLPFQSRSPQNQTFGPVNPPRGFTPVSPQSFGGAPSQAGAQAFGTQAPGQWASVSPTPVYSPGQNQFVEPPPATITLRESPPVHQLPPAILASQPATNTFRGGVNMRGDQKWPPQTVKEGMEAENEARITLAKGPACRPRKIKKDYSQFFAKNALPHNYAGYKVPPGTQHFEDFTGQSQF